MKNLLPQYMVPRDFVVIDKLPLTANGKLDVKALPRSIRGLSVLSKKVADDSAITPLQKGLIDIWANVLSLESVGLNDNFFDIGGHSLIATTLIHYVHKQYGVKIPIKNFFMEPTILGMSEYITLCENGDVGDNGSLHDDDISLDILLPTDIHPMEDYIYTAPKNILLTGATGFYGAFLLKTLLESTTATVYCLVRGKDLQDAGDRIEKSLKEYDIYNSSYKPRIVPIAGDLSQPYFGLGKEKFLEYSTCIDTILHNAAYVNFIQPYKMLKPANVDGTVEIVRFASQGKVKPIHFVSTLYVYEPSMDNSKERYIYENTPLGSYKGLKMGYTQTKWVAENILELAQKAGIPVNIYRLGRISGSSENGACQTKDFFWSLVKGCLEIGACPTENIQFEMSPVDYLSEAVVRIIKSGILNEKFHLFNKSKTDLNMITGAMENMGYKLDKLPSDQWNNLLSNMENYARPVSELITDNTFEGGKLDFDNQNAVRFMPELNNMKINSEMISRIATFFINSGYFPKL